MKIKRLFRSRSAEFNIILVMLITLLAGIVLIYAGYKLAVNSKEINDDKKCQLSFFAATQMSKVYSESGKLMDVPVSIECPRHEVEIDVDSSTVKRGKIIDDLVKSKIAKEMMSCWSKTGAGKLDPSKAGGYVYSTKERFCLICGELTFSDKFKALAQKQNYQVSGIGYWAATRRVPGQKVTLFEWITGNKVDNEEILRKLKQSEDGLNGVMGMNTKYVVLWRADVYKASTVRKAASFIAKVMIISTAIGFAMALPGGAFLSIAAFKAAALTATAAVGAAQGLAAGALLGLGMGTAIEGSSGQAKAEVHLVPMDYLTDHKPPGSDYAYCSFMYN